MRQTNTKVDSRIAVSNDSGYRVASLLRSTCSGASCSFRFVPRRMRVAPRGIIAAAISGLLTVSLACSSFAPADEYQYRAPQDPDGANYTMLEGDQNTADMLEMLVRDAGAGNSALVSEQVAYLQAGPGDVPLTIGDDSQAEVAVDRSPNAQAAPVAGLAKQTQQFFTADSSVPGESGQSDSLVVAMSALAQVASGNAASGAAGASSGVFAAPTPTPVPYVPEIVPTVVPTTVATPEPVVTVPTATPAPPKPAPATTPVVVPVTTAPVPTAAPVTVAPPSPAPKAIAVVSSGPAADVSQVSPDAENPGNGTTNGDGNGLTNPNSPDAAGKNDESTVPEPPVLPDEVPVDDKSGSGNGRENGNKPSVEPTPEPIVEPTAEPTETTEPTVEPTETPEPTATPEPTVEPTPEPTAEPTKEPTPEPTAEPHGSSASASSSANSSGSTPWNDHDDDDDD